MNVRIRSYTTPFPQFQSMVIGFSGTNTGIGLSGPESVGINGVSLGLTATATV